MGCIFVVFSQINYKIQWETYTYQQLLAALEVALLIGNDLKIVVFNMDAFYVNSDNYNIPVMEALRIVSLMQDGERKKANLRLLKAQRKYIKM